MGRGGKYRAAITNFNRAINIQVDNPEVYFCRGYAFAFGKNLKNARFDFTKVISLTRSNPNELTAASLAVRAEINYRSRQCDACINDATSSIQINPDSTYAYRMLGIGYMCKKLYRQAITAFSGAIDLDGNDLIAHINRYKCFLALGLLEDALLDIEVCMQLQPGNVDLRNLYNSISIAITEGQTINNTSTTINISVENNFGGNQQQIFRGGEGGFGGGGG